MELLLLFVSHNKMPCCGDSNVIFKVSGSKRLLQKLAHVLLPLISKNLARPLLIFNATFVFEYYKEITFVIGKTIVKYFIKTIQSIAVCSTQPIDT